MIAIRQDTEALFAAIFLPHHVKADAARFLLRALDGEGEFHFFLVGGDAFRIVTFALLLVEWIETEFPAQLAKLTVCVGAGVVATKSALHEIRAQCGGVIDGNPLFFHSIGAHDIGV